MARKRVTMLEDITKEVPMDGESSDAVSHNFSTASALKDNEVHFAKGSTTKESVVSESVIKAQQSKAMTIGSDKLS